MEELYWHYLKEYSDELYSTLKQFFETYRSWFSKKCELSMLYPNYVAISSSTPKDIKQSTVCYQIAEGVQEYVITTYPRLASEDLAQDVDSQIPDFVKDRVDKITVEFTSTKLAKWIVCDMLALAYGMAHERAKGKWKQLNKRQALKLLDFVNKQDNKAFRNLSMLLWVAMEYNRSIAIGIMDTNFDYNVRCM